MKPATHRPHAKWFAPMLALLPAMASAQAGLSNEYLFNQGYQGHLERNCVKASRFWFAYLLQANGQVPKATEAFLKEVIQKCDQSAKAHAGTYCFYSGQIPFGKEGKCQAYSRYAIEQQQLNAVAHCGLQGSRWSTDYQHHYRWCMSAPEAETVSENKSRQTALETCEPELAKP